MCCSSCIIYMPLLAFLFISTIVTCSFYPHHQHHYELCFHCFCSESRATVSTPATVFHCHCHSVPLCFNSVYFCATVFKICVFFIPLCFRSTHLLCYCVLDLFYHTTVFQIWFQQKAISQVTLHSLFQMISPPQKKKKINIETFSKVTVWNNSFS